MDSKLWGSYVWYFIHLVCFAYNPELYDNNVAFEKFFEMLKEILACQKCKTNYKVEIIKLKPKYSNLKGWSIEFHNLVNRRLNKRNFLIERVQEIYYSKESGELIIKYDKLDWAINHFLTETNNLAQCKEFINVLVVIHPCPMWKNKASYALQKYPITKIMTIQEIRNWYANKFTKIIEDYDNMDILAI